jgi:hypothetical protein
MVMSYRVCLPPDVAATPHGIPAPTGGQYLSERGMQLAEDSNVLRGPVPHMPRRPRIERDASSEQRGEGIDELAGGSDVLSPSEWCFALRSRAAHTLIVRMFDSTVKRRRGPGVAGY